MRMVNVVYLVALFATPSYAQMTMSVGPFANETRPRCAGTKIPGDLQVRLTDALMGLERYVIREREVRPVSPDAFLTGAVKRFDVCPKGRGQSAVVALEVTVRDNEGMLVRRFTASAQVPLAQRGQAQELALQGAITELTRRLDGLRGHIAIGAAPRATMPTGVELELVRRTRTPASSRIASDH